MEAVRKVLQRLEPDIPHTKSELFQGVPKLSDRVRTEILNRMVQAKLLVSAGNVGVRAFYKLAKTVEREHLKATWEDAEKVAAIAFTDLPIQKVFNLPVKPSPTPAPVAVQMPLGPPPTAPSAEEVEVSPEMLIRALAAIVTSQERMQGQFAALDQKVSECHRMLTELMTPVTPGDAK